MEKDLFPWIGSLPLPQISAPLLLQTLRRIEGRGANETAHTLRQTSGQVFRYGVATGRLTGIDTAPAVSYRNVHAGLFATSLATEPQEMWTDEVAVATSPIACD